jgi:hypothetical protein
LISCGTSKGTTSNINVKKVAFKTPVNTLSRKIDIQDKKIYNLENSDIYLSNKFDGARLNGVKKINDSTAILFIKPENSPINNSAYYAFKVWSSTKKHFYFTFSYPEGYKHRYIPKLKINDSWTIIDEKDVFKKGKTVTVKLNLSSNTITVSAQEVENSEDVKKWYTSLIVGKESYVQLKSAGKSVSGRDLPVLDIYKGDKKNKEIIVLLTRQHPPEVTGYYAFQSFLETILNDSELSKQFLNKYRVLAFPILNPDGVDMGHWRHNYGGIDLNRDWSVYNQPEVKNVVTFISKTLEEDDAKIILGLDFHSTYKDIFYTNKVRESTTMPNFIRFWFAGLEENIPNYKVNEASGNSTKPVSKGWFLYGHNAVGITYEIGDKTPKEFIDLKGRVSANQMMKIVTYLRTK